MAHLLLVEGVGKLSSAAWLDAESRTFVFSAHIGRNHAHSGAHARVRAFIGDKRVAFDARRAACRGEWRLR
jgi:hypothetical protein